MPTMSDATMKMWAWVVAIIMGICAIVRHKQLALRAKRFQLKWFNIHTNEKWDRAGYLVVGTFFVIFGLIQLLKILIK
jgi:hypothetical protein